MSKRVLLSTGFALTLPLFALGLSGCEGGKPDTHAADGTIDAARVYRLYCAGCHGEDGKRGEGEMVLVNGQPPKVAEIREVIENGRKQMPAWKKRLTAEEITAVVEYVRSLQAGPGMPGTP